MESQGEREPGVVEMDVGLVESMVQDENPEQEMFVMQEQFPPQTDPEPEMSAAAAAAYDTSPSPSKPPDPGRVGSAECTRHGPAMRHAGGSKRDHATNAKRNKCKCVQNGK